MLSTIISLRVSVPVLSVQMTLTEPNVSTAGSRRTMALRRAMRCTPMASVIVMIAGSPSGMAATARPTAARNMSSALNPYTSTPKPKTKAASARTSTVSARLKRAICCISGVVSVVTSLSIVLIRPISVLSPVATTTPLPRPEATSVPVYIMQFRSPRAADGSTGAVFFSTATDSPVSAASCTRRLLTSIRRTSAGTLSPELHPDDIARHQGFGRNRLPATVAHNGCLQR